MDRGKGRFPVRAVNEADIKGFADGAAEYIQDVSCA